MQNRTRTPKSPSIDLPPPFRVVTLREVGDAFAYAKTIAAELGAGTLVHVGRFDLARVRGGPRTGGTAANGAARVYSSMVALRDALLAHAPPERPITFNWPDAIHVDGGLIGGGRLAWPAGSMEAEPPEWLVFGCCIRTVAMGVREAGLRPLATALAEKGFDDLGSGGLVESFARHLMFAIDGWQADGFAALAGRYVDHLTLEKGSTAALDDNGDLLVRWRGQNRSPTGTP